MVDFNKLNAERRARNALPPQERAELERKAAELKDKQNREYIAQLEKQVEVASELVNRLEAALDNGFFDNDDYAKNFIKSQVRLRDRLDSGGIKGIRLCDLTPDQKTSQPS